MTDRVSDRVKVATVPQIPVGAARRVRVDGHDVAVINLGEAGFRAVDAICTHAHYYLDEGEVDLEDETIECWKHGSTFDLNTGRPRTLPATTPVRTYHVEIDGDDILIEVSHE